jgi:hypothetical protein
MMLKRLRIAHVAILVAAAIIVVACGDQALLVSPHIASAPPLGVVANPEGAPVHPVKRQATLAEDESWSFDVGPSGTTVRYPSAGLTITVPPGAVDAPTHITVIALRGAALAYRFEPHGIQFAQPLELRQSLHGLQLGKEALGVPQLFAGYFSDDSLTTDAVSGEARVFEILPVLIDLKHHDAILFVRHFSGYTVASAAADPALPEINGDR